MAYKNGEKQVRLREIAARLKELAAEDKLIVGPDRASPDGRQQLAEIAVERRQLRDEQNQLLSDPDPEPAGIRDEIKRMWYVVAVFDERLDAWHRAAETAREEDKIERKERQQQHDRQIAALYVLFGINFAFTMIALFR